MTRGLKDKVFNKVVYISLGITIIVLIALVGIISAISNKNKGSNNNIVVGKREADAGELVEEANSSIGKTIEEVEKANSTNSENTAESNSTNGTEQSDNESSKESTNGDNTQINGGLATELNTAKEDDEKIETKLVNEDSYPEVEKVDGIAIVVNSEDVANTTSEMSEENSNPSFVMPVVGDIIKHYGKEKLVYSNTLKEWTTHLGIDVKADKTTIVKASADGVVKSIKNDPRYGLTVIIEHENGFSSVYANLLTAEFVVEGEEVKQGQTLGTVGNSATFEILDEPHLHFEILKDGNSVDPEMYLK